MAGLKDSHIPNLDNLRELREKKGLTQEDMAEVLNCSISHYQRKEAGKCYIRLHEAKKLADYFGMKIDSLFYSKYFGKLKDEGFRIGAGWKERNQRV